jgi:GNAT superfamily N-acetyltransferase
MSNVATIRSSTGTGVIRLLQPNEHRLLRAHLLRLSPASRRDRFNGGISDSFIKTYASRCFERGTIVFAYLQDGDVRAAAELHAPERSADHIPEIAFSVEDRLRRQGVGTALFEQIVAEARRRGYARLRITTSGQNHAMKALAGKFGAHLTFASGEATGIIDLTHEDRSTAAAAPQRGRAGAPALAALAATPWGMPLSSLLLAREFVRASQTMWEQVLRMNMELLKLRPLLRFSGLR